MMIELGSTPVAAPRVLASVLFTEPMAGMEPLNEEAKEDGENDEGAEVGVEEDEDEIAGDPYRTRRLDGGFPAGPEKGSSLPGGTAEIWWAPRTSGYLSPEQIRGEPVDERSDIFSLGVVAYEMCAGRLPFEGRTANSMLNSILQSPPPPLNELDRKSTRLNSSH